ncbi:hypothetical protein J6590_075865, partial [Homalodisca vitripennis]
MVKIWKFPLRYDAPMGSCEVQKLASTRPQDLPAELENELVQHVKDLGKMFLGVAREDLKKLA